MLVAYFRIKPYSYIPDVPKFCSTYSYKVCRILYDTYILMNICNSVNSCQVEVGPNHLVLSLSINVLQIFLTSIVYISIWVANRAGKKIKKRIYIFLIFVFNII